MFFTRLLCALSIISRARADFELYRYYDANDITEAWSITDACLTALNTTVQCDESVVSLLGNGADYNYWYMENITNLCSTTCQTSLATWGSQVETACDGQTVLQGGAEVQAKALTLTFTYGSGLVCMQDSSDNWCFYDSQNWQGSDYMRWDPEMCMPDGLNDTDIPAICDDEDFDIDSISNDMSSMTTLYDSSFFCDECFLKLFRQRLVDPWLVDSNFTGYLITEFDKIQGNCSTTLPYTTSAATLYIGTATATATAGNEAATTTTTTAQATCTGQTIDALNSSLTCNDLSDTYNVSTGDARVYTGDYSCIFKSTVCLPLPCGLDTVWDAPTCAELAARYSNSTYNITETQFLSWNSNIQGSCDGVARGQRVCTEAPGGTFPSPTATIHAQTGTTYYTTATAAYPTQTGTIEDCGKYYLVTSGDDCSTVNLVFGINLTQLQSYNTYLNANCSNLWLNYDVCVGEVTPPAVSTDGTCGVSVTCEGSDFGDCCSAYGFCGSGSEYCSSTTNNGTATTDGTCGPDNGGTTCTNPDFGSCCSIYGNCGNGTDYCGAGNCYSGSCDTDTGGPSTNGECGPLFAGNKTCSGTQFGNCCSTSGYCGNGTDYCVGSNCYSGLCTT